MSHLVGSFRISGDHEHGVQIVQNAEELWKIGELRYSLYVARDLKAYPEADHVNQCFLEPVDGLSLNLFGAVDERCLTALRLTKAHLALEDKYLRRVLKNSPIGPARYDELVLASRLVSRHRAEARLLLAPILRESYRLSFLNGINFCVQATRRSLVPFFTRMGFKICGTTYSEEIAGELNVLLLDFRDRETLSASNSLFLDLLSNLTASAAEATT
jgi:hypothetical protein